MGDLPLGREKNFKQVVDPPTPAHEQFLHLIGVINSVELPVQGEVNAPAGEEMALGVIEEVVPLGHPPGLRLVKIVEHDLERCHEIVFPSCLGKRLELFHPVHRPLQAEELKHLLVQLGLWKVQAKPGVPQNLADEKEITGAGPYIENVQRAGRSIDPDVLHASDIGLEIGFGIGILRPLARIMLYAIGLPDPPELRGVDLL